MPRAAMDLERGDLEFVSRMRRQHAKKVHRRVVGCVILVTGVVTLGFAIHEARWGIAAVAELTHATGWLVEEIQEMLD